MSHYVTAREAKRLRKARHLIRKYERIYERDPSAPSQLDRARYERSVSRLVAFRLSGGEIAHDEKSLPLPINTTDR